MLLAADLLLHIDDLTAKPANALRTMALNFLDGLPVAIPMACVVGAAWSMSRAVRFREITAIRCGGIPLQYSLLPILAVGLLIAAGLAFFEDRVLVPIRGALLQADLGDQDVNAPRPRLLNDRWWYAKGSFVLSAEEFNGDASVLTDVSVFRLDDNRKIVERIIADEAAFLEENAWEFRNARTIQFGGPERFARSTAPTLQMNLGLSDQDLARAVPPSEAMTLRTLRRRVRKLEKIHDPAAPLLASAYHARLAQPLSILILLLLVIPIAIGDVERGDSLSRALLQSIAVSAGFWGVWVFAILTSRSGILPAAIPIWGACTAVSLFGYWRFRTINE